MEEKTQANVPLIDNANPVHENNNQDEEKCPLKKQKIKYDTTQEDIEDRENLQTVLKKVEAKLNKDLIKEKNNKQNGDKEKEKEIKDIEDLDFLKAFQENKHKRGYAWLLFAVFSIFLPFFIIINLIGIFQIISVMNAVGEVIKRSIVCYLGWDDEEEESYYEFNNFYGFYFKSSIEEGIDYDLIETMSFLGTIFIKFYGFSVSSGFFMLINVIALFLIMNFFSEYSDVFERYTLLNIIYLIVCYILLFIGVGSSALLSQQLLIENYEKYTLFYKLKSKKEKEAEKKAENKIEVIREAEEAIKEDLITDKKIKEDLIKEEDKMDEENKEIIEKEELIEEDKKEEEKKEEKIKEEEIKDEEKKEVEKKEIKEEEIKEEDKKDEEKKEEEKKDEGILVVKAKKDEEKKEDKKEDKKKEETDKDGEEFKEPYFILVCVTSIIGFLFKYLFDIIISYNKYSFDGQYEDQLNGNTSAIDYNTTKSHIKEEIFKHDKFLFYFIIIIYGGSILISIGLYRLFKQVYEGDKKKKKEKKDDGKDDEDDEDDGIKKECNIFGYIVYLKQYKTKEYLMNKKDKKEEKHKKKTITVNSMVGGESDQNDKNMCERTKDKLLNFIKQLYLCIRLMSDSFISWFNEIICPYFFCGNECCYCCCCCECCRNIVKEEEYDLEEGYFCYCYKAKRHTKWFNRFIRDQTQKEILPLLLQYIIIQFNTVAFEKIFEENNEAGYNEFNDAKSIIYFILIFGTSLFLFFYLTISFGNLYLFYSRDKTKKLETKIKLGEMTVKLSNKILKGTYGIIIFNGFYSFIVSLICLKNDVNNNYVFYIPILINKFYYFTFAHQCAIYTDDDDEVNYFTLATLLSIYLQAWDLLMGLLKEIPTIVLLLFQLFFSSVIIVISLFILVLLIFYIGKFMFTILYFISFLFSFGGFWFIYCYDKFKWEHKKLFKFKEYVPSTDVFGKEILNRLKNKLITN